MKKEVFVFILLFLLVISLISSAEVNESKIDDAYNCLQDKVKETTCDGLSLQEQIFSALAIKKCKTEILENSNDEECWPASSCTVKDTAQAIWALQRFNVDTTSAEEWLIAQNTTPTDLNWFLQIESPEITTCKISVADYSRTIEIGEDKKISSTDGDLGTCIEISSNGYWVAIKPACYPEEFTILCDQSFLTNLLFMVDDSSTVHVSENTHSASGGAETQEKINSYCFKQSASGSCDYQSSLWATRILDAQGYDVSPFFPYLITNAENYENYLPEAFLYYLTLDSEYLSDLLSFQKTNGYWEALNGRYYDTALVLWHLQYESLLEKDEAVEWLMDIQGDDGCWDSGNIRSTAFILYSLWERDSFDWTGEEEDCLSDEECSLGYECIEDICVEETDITKINCSSAGYSCISAIGCSDLGGSELTGYSCTGSYVCCNKAPVEQTCSDLEGEICSTSEDCVGGIEDHTTSGLSYGEFCCIGGECQTGTSSEEEADCEPSGGTCRAYGCNDDEEESYLYSCDYSSDSCCMKKKAAGSYWWIWILLILIVLVGFGIIYKDKLKALFIKLKTRLKKNKYPKSTAPPSRGPPPMMRRILPPAQQRPLAPKRPPQKPRGELDEVLKKLKDIGK